MPATHRGAGLASAASLPRRRQDEARRVFVAGNRRLTGRLAERREHRLAKVHLLGWTVMVYNIAETLPNFINPFWMLPLLGVLGLKSRDLIGYTAVQFMIHLPVMLLLAAILMTTFTYHPPILP